MACSVCCPNNGKSVFDTSGDCVQDALEKIRLHYLSLRKSAAQKQSKLQELEERNERLMKAVELLQREHPNNKQPRSWETDEDYSFNDEASLVPKFNMALNSEDLFDSSSESAKNETFVNLAQQDHSEDDVQLAGDSMMAGRGSIHEETKIVTINNENNNRSVNEEHEKKSKWLSKKNSVISNDTSTRLLPIGDFKLLDYRQKVKQLSLTLNKGGNRKLKQTHLEPIRTSRLRKDDTTICDKFEDGDIKPSTSLKRTKIDVSRDFRDQISKPLNPSKMRANVECDGNNDVVLNCLTKTTEIKIENVFEMRIDDDITTQATGTSKNNDSTFCNNVLPFSESKTNSDSSSLVILTPKTPDIIFIDDTDDNIQLETTNLLQHLIEATDYEKIKVLPDQHTKPSKELPAQCGNKCTKPQASANDENLKPKCVEPEESEEFMVRPIMVKNEAITPKKSIKERFNIDCRDCENYISFLGDNLTDEQIQAHLNKCSRHKRRDEIVSNTPAGFWNPLMLSFPPDDPRNEVLVDERFVGNKRVGRYGSKYV